MARKGAGSGGDGGKIEWLAVMMSNSCCVGTECVCR